MDDYYKRDLILRKTERIPGIYEDPNDANNQLVVVAYHDGTSRIMIWCDSESGSDMMEQGDLCFEGCWFKNVSSSFGIDESRTVTHVDIEVNNGRFIPT